MLFSHLRLRPRLLMMRIAVCAVHLVNAIRGKPLIQIDVIIVGMRGIMMLKLLVLQRSYYDTILCMSTDTVNLWWFNS